MVTLHLTGKISTDGELQITLPPGVPPGEVEVTITVPSPIQDNETWTDEEIQQMMQIAPKTGAEIAAMLDDMEAGYQHIRDSVAWVEVQRRKYVAQNKW